MPDSQMAGRIVGHELRVARLETLEGGGGGGGGGTHVLWCPLFWGGAVLPARIWFDFRWLGISGTVVSWSIYGQIVVGTITVDILKSTHAAWTRDNTGFASICGGNQPALVAADKDYDNTLAGWSTAVAASDIWRIYTAGVATALTRVDLHIRVDE